MKTFKKVKKCGKNKMSLSTKLLTSHLLIVLDEQTGCQINAKTAHSMP